MMTEEENMRMELQRMQRQADETTDKSLESTRRMVRMAEETQDTGIQTLVALDEQGEKLNRIESNLDEINNGMKEAERNLTGLEKFCGLCVCSCKKQPEFESTDAYRKAYKKEDGPSGNNTANSKATGSGQNGAAKSGYITRVTNDDREDEMDENLGQVAGIVDNLKTMALDMGGELERQNVQLERLGNKAGANEVRIEHANKRAENILRK